MFDISTTRGLDDVTVSVGITGLAHSVMGSSVRVGHVNGF